MELSVAEVLAKKLMHEFNLFPRCWRFEFDNSKSRFGCCHTRKKLITLSRHIVQLNSQIDVEDTIRHEIAHALVTEDKLTFHAKNPFSSDFGRRSISRRDIHGADWKAKCLITGAKPERCYDGAVVVAPKGNWTATCPNCGKVVHYHRRSTKSSPTACYECCKNFNHGRWSEKFIFIYRHRDSIGEHIPANAPKPAPQTQTPDHRAAIERMKEQIRLAEKQEILDRIIALETQLTRN
jgi:predicted SprT family Zn-dependent metalloprotease